MSKIFYPARTFGLNQKFGRRRKLFGNPSRYNRFYANDTTAYVPEMWAAEAVRVLVESMVMASTVHRDFEPEIARFGETVHTRKPGTFQAQRKQNDLDNLVTSNATATNIDVKLNQRVFVSFVLGDGERSKSFQDLVSIFLRPAMEAQARFVDRALAGQVYQFMDNTAGGLDTMTKTNGHDYLMDARDVLNNNKVGASGRWLGMASRSETYLQKNELFKDASKVGDDGTALADALLGRKGGFNIFLELNMPSVRGATTTGTTTTVSGAHLAGDTTIQLAVGGVAAAGIVTGMYVVIAGDDRPRRVTVIATDLITIDRGIDNNVANGAVVTAYASALINQNAAIAAGDTTAAVANGYPSGWMKGIAYDGTGVPKIGQMVAFKAAGGTLYTPVYSIVDIIGSEIWLDRPLESTVADNDIIDLGPSGDYNFGYQREALTLVNRPLALPEAGTGARAAQAILNNVAMRVVLTYDGVTQGTRVTCDALFGHAILDTDRGCVLLG